ENPVDFVAYGPLGELRQFNRTYRVLNELLPAKRFEYGVSGGSCRTPQCRSSANLDLRYGGGDRWTIQAGYDRFWRDSLGDLSHPYVGITTNPTNAWAVDAMAVQGAFTKGEVRFEPTVDLRLSGGYTRFAIETAAPIHTADMRLLPELRTSWEPGQPARSAVALSAYVLPRASWGPLLGSVWLRGAVSEELNGPARLASFEAFAGRPLWAGVRVEMGTS